MTSMPAAINKLFWGLIIVLLDFNIIFFDVFPDFIGYAIVASGLGQLQPYSASFLKARLAAVTLSIFSFLAMFQIPVNLLEGFQPTGSILLMLLATAILSLIHILLVSFAITGLIEISGANAEKRLTGYIIISLISIAAIPFILNIGEHGAILIIFGCAFAAIAAEIMILVLLRNFRSHFMEQDKANMPKTIG